MLFQPTVSDVPEIARLLSQTKQQVFNNLSRCVICKDYDGNIIGYASYKLSQYKGGQAEILDIYVAQKERNKRNGDFLMMELAIEFGRFKVRRVVVETTIPKFFEKYGFRTVSKGKDNFTMAKEIPE